MNKYSGKYAFWVANLSLIISLSLILIIVMDVWNVSVIDSNTFISTLVAMMAIIFTLVVGFQIYNVLEIKDKLSEIETIKKNLENSQKEISKEILNTKKSISSLSSEHSQGVYILQARMYKYSSSQNHASFLKMLSAIRYALDVEHKTDGYGWMLEELKEYMLIINNTYPFNSFDRNLQIKGYKEYYKIDNEAIKNHVNYFMIKDRYEPLMDEFEQRLQLISEGKNMSTTELTKEIH